MSSFWQKLKSHKLMRWFRLITESAAFALLLSIIFFTYEMIENMNESKEITDNLIKIQNSLSTKYLGVFPNYLPTINELFAEASKSAVDSVIIFEDVLYYGIKSKPEDFKQFNKHLLELRHNGSQVIVAYYNPNSIVFHKMVQDGRFPSYISAMQKEKKQMIDSINSFSHVGLKEYAEIDSTLSEKYFQCERNDNPKKFKREVKTYLREIQNLRDNNSNLNHIFDQDVNAMCQNIDSIKKHYLGKDENDIHFTDYKQMYTAITQEIVLLYSKYNFELIPLNEYLMMSCWLAGDKIIFAFPSKDNTDEIGFMSQDPAFSNYVKTMLKGVQQK